MNFTNKDSLREHKPLQFFLVKCSLYRFKRPELLWCRCILHVMSCAKGINFRIIFMAVLSDGICKHVLIQFVLKGFCDNCRDYINLIRMPLYSLQKLWVTYSGTITLTDFNVSLNVCTLMNKFINYYCTENRPGPVYSQYNPTLNSYLHATPIMLLIFSYF